MSDYRELAFRDATVILTGAREGEMLHGAVCVNGPWVHVENVERAHTRPYRSSDDPVWEPCEDISISASEVRELRWETRVTA